MADDTAYTVVDTLDDQAGAGIGSFYEKLPITVNQPVASTDNTTYTVADDVSGNTGSIGIGSFYKRNPNV